jgi:cytochrome b pre-mRNA-processing protein 3
LTAGGGAAAKVSQALFNLMFEDMDVSLREMGVGDLTVPKRIKEMGEAFYGRARAYDAALAQDDVAALEDALGRNVYRGAPPGNLALLSSYVRRAYAAVQDQRLDDLSDGRVTFPEVEAAD